MTARYARLRYSARKRGLEVAITRGQFELLIAPGRCDYCRGRVGQTGTGLDRVDSRKGYILGNLVPCCGECNRIKGATLTHAQMLQVGLLIQGWRR